ncbi:MAG TPA: peptidoglycan-binding domain-containing protein, partial [Phycisphaerae bacterium]|nr:peptidoglycan-binding domain-containing protein [Phycisphaerae bacterium]
MPTVRYRYRRNKEVAMPMGPHTFSCRIGSMFRMRAAVLAGAIGLAAAPLAAAKPTGESASLRATVALQIALDRSGFSPGLIDGIFGGKTTASLREFQRSRGMPATGNLDAATRAALRVDEEDAFIRYTITAADRAAVGPLPKGWIEKSQLDRLPYPSLLEALCEKFHCS